VSLHYLVKYSVYLFGPVFGNAACSSKLLNDVDLITLIAAVTAGIRVASSRTFCNSINGVHYAGGVWEIVCPTRQTHMPL